MSFSKDLIAQVKELNPIEDVVRHFSNEYGTPLEDKGNEIKTYHHIWEPADDAGTALWATVHNQMFHCFSCQLSGDVITLVQSFLHGNQYEAKNVQQFRKALSWLCERAGIDYNEDDDLTPELFELRIAQSIFEFFIECCTTQSYHPNYVQKLYSYVEERYPLSEEIIKKYKICYFDRKWLKPLWTKLRNKFTKEELLSSGLFKETPKGVICTFQNRLIIPYLSKGDIVYLIGREVRPESGYEKDGEWWNYDGGGKFKKLPVYKEDKPDTHHICKMLRNDHVFGCDSIKWGTDIFITEGIGDCLVLLQQGFNAISPVTVKFKNEMLEPVAEQLMRVRQIYICNDNEASGAGANGAVKMFDFFNSKGLDVKIITLPLPDGKTKIDVADYFRTHSNEDFLKLAISSKSILDIEIDALSSESHQLDIEKTWGKILNISQSFTRENYKEKLAKRVNKSVSKLDKMLGSVKKQSDLEDFLFDIPLRIAPALDFNVDEYGTRCVYLTQYVPRKKILDDGTIETYDVPILLTSEVDRDNKYTKTIRDLEKDPLSPEEMARLPHPIHKGRWRLQNKYPFSLNQFMTKTSPVKPELDATFHQILKLYDKYLWYKNDYDKLLQTIYVMATYYFQMFNAFPSLHLTGKKDTGKSTAMNLATWLSFNGVLCVEVTPANLFRNAHSDRSTLMIDEAERFSENKDGDTRTALSILRGRYKAGTLVARQEKIGDKMQATYFDCYGPTILGSINYLEDALASRTIPINSASKPDLYKMKSFCTDELYIKSECAEIRDKLYFMLMTRFNEVFTSFDLVKEDPRIAHIKDRELEKWLPLFTIAHWIDRFSKNTSKDLVSELVKVQKDKFKIRKVTELSTDREYIILDVILTILKDKNISKNMRAALSENGDVNVGEDGFFAQVNTMLTQRQFQKHHDIKSRADIENVMRKTGVWDIDEGIPVNNRIVINIPKLEQILKKITGK